MLRPIAQLRDTEVEDLLFGEEDASAKRRPVIIELKVEEERRDALKPLRALIKRFAAQHRRAA